MVLSFPERISKGIVQNAMIAMAKKNMEMHKKEALQSKILVANPEDMLPSRKPIGFAAPKAPVTKFRRRPSGYAAKRMPMAGGEIAAVPKPRKPHRTFRVIAFGENAVMNEKRLRKAMPVRTWIFRPKRSAVFPKKSMKDPLARLRRRQLCS
jgi:hypothetical protein